jgi:hypothetical protein
MGERIPTISELALAPSSCAAVSPNVSRRFDSCRGTEEFSQRFRGVVRNPPLTLQSRPQSVRSGERGDETFWRDP